MDQELEKESSEKSQFLSQRPCKAKPGAACEGWGQDEVPVDRAL